MPVNFMSNTFLETAPMANEHFTTAHCFYVNCIDVFDLLTTHRLVIDFISFPALLLQFLTVLAVASSIHAYTMLARFSPIPPQEAL